MEFIGKCLFIDEGKKKKLIIGDLHLGWEESLISSGVFVSKKLIKDVVSYLEGVFEITGRVDEVILLGDVKHEFGKIMRQEWNDVTTLFDFLLKKCEKVIIVKGNHDAILEPIVRRYENVQMKSYYFDEGVAFMHGDKDFVEIYDNKIKSWIIGHGHPAIKLKEPGGAKIEKYKCYLVGRFKGKKVNHSPTHTLLYLDHEHKIPCFF